MIRWLSMVMVLLVTFSVTAGDRLPPQVEVESLTAGARCGDTEMGVRWLSRGDIYQRFADDNHHLLLISMGQQSSAGYSLTLLSTTAPLVDGVVSLQVAWNSPPADMMVAQVVTEPCLVLALKRQTYEGVQVVDSHGKPKMTLSRSSPE
ncbi:hypothetical protein MNBD_GAMMA18-1655 [hydrothermal vent metagenome]|uniref:PrcB C-terminal domain-containing protein n=1 Tax=hydrothermal vent metagenome TaxID=652676 RepID=A0A3B0ZKN5_9ZZZZ